MRLIRKDLIRFGAVPHGSSDAVMVEIRVEPDRFGGWETRTAVRCSEDAPPTVLARTFRSRNRSVAAGKMIAWIRGRYAEAWPVAAQGTVRCPARRS